MLRAAQLYYEQDVGQGEIAKILDTSRTTVSRMLADARQSGLVQITVHQPLAHDSELSQQLRTELGIKDAIAISSDDPGAGVITDTARGAAEFLSGILSDGHTIGITWGRTVAAVVAAMEPLQLHGISVVQVLGSLGQGDPAIDGPVLARGLADTLAGTYRFVNAPAVVESAELCGRLARQPQIRQVLDHARRADVYLLSVGSTEDDTSSLQRTGYLTDAERRAAIAQGAVGHLMARMIDIDGNELEAQSDRVVGIPLSALRGRPWTICVAGGRSKAAAVLGSVRGGYVNALVLDSDCADEVLRLSSTALAAS